VGQGGQDDTSLFVIAHMRLLEFFPPLSMIKFAPLV